MPKRFDQLSSGAETQRIWDEAARREDSSIITPKLPRLATRYEITRPTSPSAAEVFSTTLRNGLAQTVFNRAFDSLYPGVAEQLPDNSRAAFLLGLDYARQYEGQPAEPLQTDETML